MTITYPLDGCDSATFELESDANEGQRDLLVLGLGEWLYENFGQELDCDAVLITLVWVQEPEEGAKRPPQGSES